MVNSPTAKKTARRPKKVNLCLEAKESDLVVNSPEAKEGDLVVNSPTAKKKSQ